LSEPTQVICCAFCGWSQGSPAPVAPAMTAHILRCPRHPLAILAQHNVILLDCLIEVLAWLRRPPGGRASEAMVAQALEKVLDYVEGG
jgi:hypothetical protein